VEIRMFIQENLASLQLLRNSQDLQFQNSNYPFAVIKDHSNCFFPQWVYYFV